MSWLYSRVLVEDFLAVRCLAGEPYVESRSIPIARAYLPPGKMMAFSRLSRFGMTFAPLTENLGAELLTWYLAAFRAKTLALREGAKESRDPEVDYGVKWRGSLAKYDPVTCSWKTVQLSLLGDSELSSVTWPRSGMTQGGQCWELPMLGRRTRGRDCGLLPTLTVCGNHNRKGASPTSGDGLVTVLKKLYPTLTSRDWKSDSCGPEYRQERDAMTIGKTLPWTIGGLLNPTWCEWFMGFPLGWTELAPLATPKSPNAQPQPGESLPDQ